MSACARPVHNLLKQSFTRCKDVAGLKTWRNNDELLLARTLCGENSLVKSSC